MIQLISHDRIGTSPKGSPLIFEFKVNRRLGAVDVRLMLGVDGSEQYEYHMLWTALENGFDVYKILLSDFDVGLYFYNFLIDGRIVGLYDDITISLDCHRPVQLTVYDTVYSPPEFMLGGIMYHVMVDRFYYDKRIECRTDVVYRDWGDIPIYAPNAQGKVVNNDFFGGNLKGIIAKLDYLNSLGVTVLYLSPIFEAYSNHKYDTADYMTVDPMFGSNKDLIELCAEAKKLGISVILDGVFNHTGSDSIYFNKYGKYPSLGAFQSRQSPYYSWFNFRAHPKDYESWWGIETLPSVDEHDPSYKEFISGKDGVIRHWIDNGISGWRLDVADELPDSFLECITQAAKASKADALVLGEVWEDASNKVSYSERRRYFLGKELDSVTNYIFKNAVIDYCLTSNAESLATEVSTIVYNYPPNVLNSLMNILGSHDTSRILTVLSGVDPTAMSRDSRARHSLLESEYSSAKRRLKVAASIQYLLPGVPCLLYGDEVGVQGHEDPLNRRCYPWGNEDREILDFYKTLASIRKSHLCLKDGTTEFLYAESGVIALKRQRNNDSLMLITNLSNKEFSVDGLIGKNAFDGARVSGFVTIGKGEMLLLEVDENSKIVFDV